MMSYSDYLNRFFPGQKIQKISINAGFSCPNRDGVIGKGGCIYCRNDSFSPTYCKSQDSVSTQIEKGIKFFSAKYPDMNYLAFFQSYTGTYNKPLEQLRNLYTEALRQKNVVGLVVATRPDCLSEEILQLLAEINFKYPVFIELGVETSHNNTLRIINRNHSWEDVVIAVNNIAKRGLHCGVHLIIGLPGESKEMIMDTIDRISCLPIETIKLHQLQVLKDTKLAEGLDKGLYEIWKFSLDEYLELCAEIVKRLPENIIIERFLAQSPPEMVISPSWGLKNYEFMAKLEKILS